MASLPLSFGADGDHTDVELYIVITNYPSSWDGRMYITRDSIKNILKPITEQFFSKFPCLEESSPKWQHHSIIVNYNANISNPKDITLLQNEAVTSCPCNWCYICARKWGKVQQVTNLTAVSVPFCRSGIWEMKYPTTQRWWNIQKKCLLVRTLVRSNQRKTIFPLPQALLSLTHSWRIDL